MSVALGAIIILLLVLLVLARILAPHTALILVPLIAIPFYLAQFSQIAERVVETLSGSAPIVALLVFAILYFGVVSDAGLFRPLTRLVVRGSRDSPIRLCVGTATLATLISLDGDGATTFIIVTGALIPLYRRLGVRLVALTTITATANGIMNIVPWGGPTALAANAAEVSANAVFVSLVPAVVAGVVALHLVAWHIGTSESRRLATVTNEVSQGSPATAGTGDASEPSDDAADGTSRPRWWFNLVLTILLLVGLVLEPIPLVLLFMLAFGIALVVNVRGADAQRDLIIRLGPNIILVASLILAASVFSGVLRETGILRDMAQALADVIPAGAGPLFALAVVLFSALNYVMSTAAFYTGMVPVFVATGDLFEIPAEGIAAATLVGQPFFIQTPFTASFLLLLALTGVGLLEHLRFALARVALVLVPMVVVAVATGAIPVG